MKFTTTAKRAALAFAAVAMIHFPMQGADPEQGKATYMTCVACHGMNGEGVAATKGPALADLSEKYIIAQLQKFKQKHRGADPKDVGGMMMAPMSMLVATPEAEANVAAYIKTLKGAKPAATLTGGDPEKGKVLYATCQACHNPDGKGNDLLNAPSLINQHDWYQLSQLQHFKSGVRGSHPEDVSGATMRPMAMMLADEQAMKDVIAYIQTL